MNRSLPFSLVGLEFLIPSQKKVYGHLRSFWVESIFRKERQKGSLEICVPRKEWRKGKSNHERENPLKKRKLLDFNVIKLKPNVELFYVAAAPTHFCVFLGVENPFMIEALNTRWTPPLQEISNYLSQFFLFFSLSARPQPHSMTSK